MKSLVALLVLPVVLGAQEARGRGATDRPAVLIGRVITDSTERPIRDTEVAVTGTSVLARSDSLGRFRFAVQPGKYEIQLRRVGFRPMTAGITFAAGDTLEADFILSRTLDRLERVYIHATAISSKLRGFDQRRSAGFGNFIGPEQMERLGSRLTSDALRMMPGPDIHRAFTSNTAWVAAGRGSYSTGDYIVEKSDRNRGAPPNRCWSTVYVDGIAVFSALPGELLFDINSIPAIDITAMEFYSSAAVIPAEFPAKRGTCGVLVIWTKS